MTRHLALGTRRRAKIWVSLLGAIWLTGCAFSTTEGEITGKSSYGCLDDSKACIDQRQSSLKLLLSDKGATWTRHPATAEDYASGVRMFAYKSRKKELACADLMRGRSEADSAGQALMAASGRLSPAQISRAKMFASEVSRELTTEARRRCKA